MSCLYDLARIPISRRCNGYYLRWYYNGWHYWLFAPGKVIESTSGEKYRTLGIQKLTIGSTQLTEPQTEAIRTIMNTREVYIYTDYGWGAVRVEPGSWEVYNNMTHGYDIEITIVIGSRHISSTGFSPAIIIPVVPSVITQCEVDIAIAGQIWMCQNYDVNYPGSRVYNDDEDNRVNFKGLYTWDQVTTPGFCPAGWHVPTLAEWNTLLTACGGGFVAGGELKEAGMTHWNLPNTGAVDTYGFAMRSTGEYSGGAYSNLGEYAFVWTADAGGVGTGKFIQFSANNVQAVQSVVATSTFLGVRLIKNYYCPACVALAATNIGNSNFTANWSAAANATGYYLDVSIDPAYGSFVSGYHNLFVGNVLSYNITGLTLGVTYYYRMRTQTVVCTSVYSNSVSQITRPKYGALYNWYAATDVRNITAVGWHVPTDTELWDLMKFLDPAGKQMNNIAGGQMKEAGTTHWTTPNTNAVNSVGFNGVGGGNRQSVFVGINAVSYFISTTPYDANFHISGGYLRYNDGIFAGIGGLITNYFGHSIRPIKDSTILTHGQTGTYIGNDGKIYRTICIGTQEIVADNLAETRYRNGDAIPEVTTNAAWIALKTGALCAYNNDWANV